MPTSMDEALQKALADVENSKRQEREQAAREAAGVEVGTCVVCRGSLIQRTTREYDPRTGPLVLGAGFSGAV